MPSWRSAAKSKCQCEAFKKEKKYVDRSDRKMSMPPDLNTGVRDTNAGPIAPQLAILPPL